MEEQKMSCPSDYARGIKQFSDDPEAFWNEFVARQQLPPEVKTSDVATEVWLKMCFDKRYAHCWVRLAGAGHDASNLPPEIKAEIRDCMLR
jgi:hypothetical protein